ncbi:uncharacterized protein BJ212DRAFT_1303077 [Suillus subaureus]|uniref:Uncharacterized protein n=1 Tax=Suillus subaureus TaxID=48587 RepID=A0A9P7J8L3_9AGAM|nr:uncharacterized protein BJ212DRAFT_1303077 [Suillus subaureus]KAG1808189.1 hypothetical protein BJ212DRAFT_1303077 [Suillus subaureus]
MTSSSLVTTPFTSIPLITIHPFFSSVFPTRDENKPIPFVIPLTGYATFVEQTARTPKTGGVLMSMDLESDVMKELASALWEIVDGYENDRMKGTTEKRYLIRR